MKRLLILVFITVIPVFAISPAALAHIVAYDGDTVVTLHIDPDDSPVAGTPEKLEFIYGTVPGTFDAYKCLCKLTIDKSGHNILQTPVPATGDYFGSLNYTFESSGIYGLKLSGVPMAGSSFKPFNVSYNIRVGTALGNSSRLSPALIGAAIAVPFAIALSTLTFYKRRR